MGDVILAKTAGFCFGVKRAVEKAYELAGKDNVYTFGPIIHNEEVVTDLERKGVRVIHNIEELALLARNAANASKGCLQEVDEQSLKDPAQAPGTIVIRSHGVAKSVYEAIRKSGFHIIDATCPFVLKIHKIVEEQSKNGYSIVVIGNEKHPEVEGIVGWSSSKTYIIDTLEKAEQFQPGKGEKLCIVSQTTFNSKKFEELVENISKKGYNFDIRNTICNATEERQTEARAIASCADAMIVIGGRSSSNTRKLYEICKAECKDTYYIQTLNDLNMYQFNSTGCIGITAGASTPNYIIEEVYSNVRAKFRI